LFLRTKTKKKKKPQMSPSRPAATASRSPFRLFPFSHPQQTAIFSQPMQIGPAQPPFSHLLFSAFQPSQEVESTFRCLFIPFLVHVPQTFLGWLGMFNHFCSIPTFPVLCPLEKFTTFPTFEI